MRRKPLTAQEHRELGKELFQMRNRLLTLSVDLADRYGKTSRSYRAANRAYLKLDSLRSELDSQLGKDWPGEFDPKVYYPGKEA